MASNSSTDGIADPPLSAFISSPHTQALHVNTVDESTIAAGNSITASSTINTSNSSSSSERIEHACVDTHMEASAEELSTVQCVITTHSTNCSAFPGSSSSAKKPCPPSDPGHISTKTPGGTSPGSMGAKGDGLEARDHVAHLAAVHSNSPPREAGPYSSTAFELQAAETLAAFAAEQARPGRHHTEATAPASPVPAVARRGFLPFLKLNSRKHKVAAVCMQELQQECSKDCGAVVQPSLEAHIASSSSSRRHGKTNLAQLFKPGKPHAFADAAPVTPSVSSMPTAVIVLCHASKAEELPAPAGTSTTSSRSSGSNSSSSSSSSRSRLSKLFHSSKHSRPSSPSAVISGSPCQQGESSSPPPTAAAAAAVASASAAEAFSSAACTGVDAAPEPADAAAHAAGEPPLAAAAASATAPATATATATAPAAAATASAVAATITSAATSPTDSIGSSHGDARAHDDSASATVNSSRQKSPTASRSAAAALRAAAAAAEAERSSSSLITFVPDVLPFEMLEAWGSTAALNRGRRSRVRFSALLKSLFSSSHMPFAPNML